ncbi:hypothetical protein ACIBEA_31065 [Streptomyces sp. NPDC051555]|uniref:hypothetical protein n=1 Tax=Streptomyces sp. NPDC051555 TaxID=3365657 RepID=UPI00379BEC0C
MRVSRGAVVAAVVVLSTMGLAGSAEAVPVRAAPAQGATSADNCDWLSDNDVVGDSGHATSGDRQVTIYTAKATDAYAKAAIEGYVARYDKVWIDRSVNLFTMGSSPGHPSTSTVQSNGGWKQCGPFEATWWNASWNYLETPTVRLQQSGRSYAVRACMLPKDSSTVTCTAWFVDHT